MMVNRVSCIDTRYTIHDILTKKMEELIFDFSEPEFIKPGNNFPELSRSVHVWRFPVISNDFSLLTFSEKEFADRFAFEGDRNRYSVARNALRLLISKYLSSDPEEIHISDGRNQKPFLSSPISPVHFNISHSGGWVLIAFASEELGIDIEKINREFSYAQLLGEHFSEREQSYIHESGDPALAFYFLWTRKEALTKAWGTGLQENLKKVDVMEAETVIEKHHKIWKLKSFCISNEYPAALAYPGKPENIFFFDGTN
jgi:4'-phosphopantetheinyl transferase